MPLSKTMGLTSLCHLLSFLPNRGLGFRQRWVGEICCSRLALRRMRDWKSCKYNARQTRNSFSNFRHSGTALMSAMGVSDVQAVDVDHCRGSKAVSFTFPGGFKFSYSGDCRPSTDFATIGKGSTVLLHEATFDDELQGDAKAKKHSTTSEALGVGVAMGARRVILTHFSQRYQKIPIMDAVEGQELGTSTSGEVGITLDATVSNPDVDTSKQTNLVKIKGPASLDMKVGIAFDFMRVKVGEIIHLEKFAPALIKHYEQQEETCGKF